MLGYIISDKDEINVENHEIQSFDILHKTNLNIFVVENNKVLYKKNNIIYYACINGHIQVLEWFKNSGYEFKYNGWAIYHASVNGHVQVLEWFKNSGYEFKYDMWAIYHASVNGHVQVLEWVKNYNVKKVIKWSKPLKFLKTIKFKTHNKYLKGYKKN
jgi:trans-aconitate methyltransferase